MSVSKKIDSVDKTIQKLSIKKQLLIDKALIGDNPTDIIKANNFVRQLQERQGQQRKSFMVDPLELSRGFQYKDRYLSVSYAMLAAMARQPIINAIIKTRLSQIADYLEPQKDEFSTGYKIRKKQMPGMQAKEEYSKAEEKEIFQIMEFLENTGLYNEWGNDNFDTFGRKFMYDSLRYDQATFEVVRDNKGMPVEFFATDASTFRVAKTYDDKDFERNYVNKSLEVKGYYPSHVQIYNNEVKQEFYPWELCFGVRNPTSSIYSNGYGISELEEIVTLVTALLWGEQYNRNFFKQGSAPKGIFKVQGGHMNDSSLQQFRQQWQAMMKGVNNAWKTPFLEAEKIEYVDLHKNNRDMEYNNWIEFLIKCSCAVFTIDPAEINFPLHGTSGSQPMFEGGNKDRVKASKDKGLYPALKFFQKKLNKYLVQHFYGGKYEFVFVGLDNTTRKDQADLDSLAVKTYKTVNELRIEKGMEEIEGGDILLDSVFAQAVMQRQMQAGEAQPFEEEGYQQESEEEDTEKAENPFKTALFSYFEKANLI